MQDHPNCFLCRHSLPEWSQAIAANAQLIRLEKGRVIFEENSPVTGIYFLHTGKVKVHKHWGEEGRELILKFAREGDVLGHRGMGANMVYPVSATAVDSGSACFISLDFFQTTLRVNHDLAYQMMLFYATELQKTEQAMRDMVHMNVKSRIASALFSLQDLFGTDTSGNIRSTLTRQEISCYAGTTYETLFKTLNEWTEQKIVAASGKSIHIYDEPRLRTFIH